MGAGALGGVGYEGSKSIQGNVGAQDSSELARGVQDRRVGSDHKTLGNEIHVDICPSGFPVSAAAWYHPLEVGEKSADS